LKSPTKWHIFKTIL